MADIVVCAMADQDQTSEIKAQHNAKMLNTCHVAQAVNMAMLRVSNRRSPTGCTGSSCCCRHGIGSSRYMLHGASTPLTRQLAEGVSGRACRHVGHEPLLPLLVSHHSWGRSGIDWEPRAPVEDALVSWLFRRQPPPAVLAPDCAGPCCNTGAERGCI